MKSHVVDTLWGGHRLRKEYNKLHAPEHCAESWELSGHPDGESCVDGGPLDGCTIRQLGTEDHDGFWGTHCPADNFPLLVKLIDAERDLSVQVHPSQESAVSALGEQGKAELWYILGCRPGASVFIGLSRQMTKDQFMHAAEDGSICRCLNRIPVSRGNVFYIQPGTVHAIGAGITLAEIQQSSTTTFRLYDYGRLGADGRPRTLHLERAAAVADLHPIVPDRIRANNSVRFPEFTLSEMYSTPWFRAWTLDVRDRVKLNCDGESFQHLLCTEGEGDLIHENTVYPFRRGDSYFLPAAMGYYEISGSCRVLLSRV